MKSKTRWREFLLLAVLFIAVWFGACYFTRSASFLEPTLNIALTDTYFYLHWQGIVLVPFLMILCFLYWIREAFYGYKRRLQNLLMVAANFVLLLYLISFMKLTNVLMPMGWTIYPPLSALPKQQAAHSYTSLYIWILLKGAIIIFILMLGLATFITGKNWNYSKHD